MNVRIKSVPNAGDLTKERLVLTALAHVDIGAYAVFCSGIADAGTPDAGPVAGPKRAYWFPDYEVNAGDVIVLYTKTGTQSKKPWNGKTAHFFYWGLSAPIWGPTVCAVLLLTSEFEFQIVE
jgi:hypothetical protein